MENIIYPGELRSKIKILEYSFLGGVYKFNDKNISIVKITNKYKRKNYSKFGVGSDESKEIIMRYRKDLNKSNAIEFNGSHYLISSVDNIENRHRYLNVVAIKQKLYSCEAFRNSIVKDEMNRPQHTLESIYNFEGYLIEKYTGYNTEKVSSNTTHTMILMTPKVIELKSGDVIEIDSVRYNVEITHTLDDYFNEYEITVTKDV